MAEECAAIQQRREVTEGIRRICSPASARDDNPLEGTEEELLRWMSILQGIVNEYQDGGDQMVEECTCGEHVIHITHEVTIHQERPWVFRGSYHEVVKVRERYINRYVSVSGIREVE